MRHTLGRLLTDLRGPRQRAEIATTIGCHPTTIWRWENDISRPRALLPVLVAMGASPEEISHALWLAST